MDLNQVFENHWLGKVDVCEFVPKLCFGTGAADGVGELAKGIAKNKNALIITDKVLVTLGTIDGPKKSLEEAGFDVDVCESEGTEPLIGETKRIIEVARGKDYGIMIGIGGGSAMDRTNSVLPIPMLPHTNTGSKAAILNSKRGRSSDGVRANTLWVGAVISSTSSWSVINNLLITISQFVSRLPNSGYDVNIFMTLIFPEPSRYQRARCVSAFSYPPQARFELRI